MAIPSVGPQAFLPPMPPPMGPPMGAPPFGNPQALPFGIPTPAFSMPPVPLQQIQQQVAQIWTQLVQLASQLPGGLQNLQLPNPMQLGAAAMNMLPPGLQNGLQNFPPPGFNNPFMPQGAPPMGALPMGAPGGFSAMG